jgi:multidrug efflux pump subunit AcrA (membrane-fusion protein)
VAAQALTTATLTSPIAGTVAAVAITTGNTVDANSTSSVITILGPGQYEVSTTVGLSLIDQLEVGDEASIAVNGITKPLRGKVTMIGVLSSSATSGDVTYPVTVLLDPVSQTLYQGSGASVDITLSEVSNVLTVPTSAVHTTGSQHSVSVLTNGAVSTVVVQVGAVGTGLTEITSGLKAGQEVVIADLNQPIVSTTTSAAGGLAGLGGNTNTRTGGAAGFGGAGVGAGVRPGG